MEAAMIYQIPDGICPWLFPALAVAGLSCQLLALFMNSKPLLLSGLIMVVAGAIGDRDLSLGVGALLAACGIWFLKYR